ncbi:hypothetical protein PG991_014125 [Apiospora marii]|uniref:Uncharacterized protein n=1 Tax=Apiospora marii TaxID=335849 RepID=A0ABR1R862_9PEZI
MQADTSYEPFRHRKPPSVGSDTASFMAVNGQSEAASSFLDETVGAPTDSRDETPAKEDGVQPPHRRASSHWAGWKWELLLLLLSILSFVATVITLYRLNNTSLDSWTFFLGLNTVVSILAAISRAALAFAVSSCVGQAKWNWYRRKQDSLYVFERFDQASRGPWGSLRLLATVRIRRWSALGAPIILTLLAYEPFMQTIITQYGVLDVDHSNGQATTGRCLRLDSGRVNFDGAGGGGFIVVNDGSDTLSCGVPDPPRSQPEFGMTAAVYNGFQSISDKRKLNAFVNCPTGNCTFDNFTSLGICNKCADISEHIGRQRHDSYFSNADDSNVASFDNMCSHANYFTMSIYNYTAFNVGNLSIANHDGLQNAASYQTCMLNDTVTYLTTNSTKLISKSFSIANTSTTTTFALFRIMRASDGYIQGKELWQDSRPTAVECELSFCAKLYSSKYENGQVIEQVLDSWSQPVPDSYKPLTCGGDERTWESQFSEQTAIGRRSDFQVAIPAAEDNAKLGIPKEGLSFNVSQAAVLSMMNWFENSFSSKMIHPATATNSSVGIAEILYNSSTNGSLDGVSSVFDAVADRLSLWMRDSTLAASETGKDVNPPHIGTMKRWTIHYGVRWPFLALPLILEVAGALYVGYSIWETKRLGVAAWKDSALATLVYGLDGEENRALLKEADMQGRGKMKRAAREMRVGMVGDSIVRVVRVPELEPDELLDSATLRSYDGQ